MKSQPKKPKRSSKEKLNETCVIYARYSSHNQKDMSIEQQVALAKEMAADLGLTVLEIYADRAISGRSDNRPSFQKMLKDAAKGGFRYVISWKSSRIGRNMLEAMLNEARLADCNVRILYVEEDFEDNAAGRFAARTMMNVNQFYSESMAEDVIRGMRSNAEHCMVNGMLPLGYKKTNDLHIEIDEPNAEVVREIFDRVAKGEQYIEIARSLNERGLRSNTGQPFNKNSFHRLLKNERYRGIYIYHDIRVEGGIPRIISDDLFFRVQEVLKLRRQSKGGRHTVFGDYLLTGKLYCGECGSLMHGISGTSMTGQAHYYYSCTKKKKKACSKKNVRRDPLEKTVARAIQKHILQDDVIQWIANQVMKYQKGQRDNPELELLHTQLADVKISISNIMKAIEAGIITDTTKDRLLSLENEQADIKAKISAAEYNIVDVDRDHVVAWLESFVDGDVDDKEYLNSLFSTFVKAVYVYDDKRVKVVFAIGDAQEKTVDLSLLEEAANSSYKLSTGSPMEPQANYYDLTMIHGMFVLSFFMDRP